MDLMSITPSIASSAAQSDVGVLVLRKVLDMEADQGAMMAKMLDQSAGLGRNMDVKA